MSVPVTKVYIGFNLAAAGSNLFILDDPTQGLLNSTYVLGGDVLTASFDEKAVVVVVFGYWKYLSEQTRTKAFIEILLVVVV